MTSRPEDDRVGGELTGRYRQFLVDFPLQHAILNRGECWSWIDTGGEAPCRSEKTLIMLPGLLGEAETSFLYIQALAEQMGPRLRVVSVSYPPSVDRAGQFCDELCDLMDHLNIQQATILGGSSGGFLAQVFARRASSRVSGLILTHTGLPSPAQARSNQFYLRVLQIVPFAILRGLMLLAVFGFFPRLTPTHAFWWAHFRQIIRCLSREALINRFALMQDFHRHYRFHAGDLAIEPGSILLMEMQRDHLTSPAEQSQMRAVYQGAKLHIFSDTAHFDSVENPDEQIRVILNFINARN